jgi:hypothetical protein
LSLGAAGRTAVLPLFAHSSLRSGARGATARPTDPGALSAGVRDPRGVAPATGRARARAARRYARTGAVLVGLEGREEPMPPVTLLPSCAISISLSTTSR